jgi:hypothetical protein
MTDTLLGLCYLAWDVFAVKMDVLFISGGPDLREGVQQEFLRFGVQLTNRGRSTGLTDWQATLIKPDGTEVHGEIRALVGDSISLAGKNGSNDYLLPECDLSVETARSLQPGDSVFGITEFVFPMKPGAVPNETKVILQATDMLGRTIKSRPIAFSDVSARPRHRFPCPIKKPTTANNPN